MDRLEKELKRIQQRTSEMIRNLTSCHRNTFDNSVSSRLFYPSFCQFTQTLTRLVPTRPDSTQTAQFDPEPIPNCIMQALLQQFFSQ